MVFVLNVFCLFFDLTSAVIFVDLIVYDVL